MWFTGYLLELIFSIENVFVFHIVAKTFRSPKLATQKALFIVICAQIIFEVIFFMGLAVRVRSMQVLPYILGMWLLYVGYHAGKDDGLEEFDLERDSSIVRASKYLLGRRFTFTYGDRNSSSIFVVKDGQLCVSLVFPLICSMLAVDFFLEVDVTLTKIEELPNQYLAFSSSAVAAFAVPELFYVARDLFQRYLYLKHGISFVLCFFGVQMLMHQVFAIPDLLGCAIIIIVMVVCMIFSPVCSNAKKLDDEDELPMSNNSLVLKSNPLEQLAHYLEPAPEPPCREKGGGRGQSEASPGTKGEKEVASSKSLAQDGGEGLWVTVPI
jgi:tellurite resistance protein TerC